MNTNVAAQIADLVRRGHRVETAAAVYGYTAEQVNSWIARGRRAIKKVEGYTDRLHANDRPYYEVYKLMSTAIAESRVSLAEEIRSHSQKDWKAAAWIAEKLHGREFRRENDAAEQLEVFLDKLADVLDSDTYERVLEIAANIDRTDSSKQVANSED